MQSGWLSIAGALGGLGVGLGAFGAHGLKQRLTPEMLDVFEVGVRYHMYHTLAMLAVAFLAAQSPWLSRACVAWLVGVIIFSGSLYALAITDIKWLGAITPIGGVAFIVGWCFVIVAALKSSTSIAE